jgi:hypothetical protein
VQQSIPSKLQKERRKYAAMMIYEKEIGLVYMVPIDAHFVSITMRITTTCSLNAPILKRSGGMFVTDATFQE